jgi:hypothetical protein
VTSRRGTEVSARGWITSVVLALGVCATSGGASAFCRTTTCTDCPRDPPTGCTIGGTPIAWPDACVSFSVNRMASPAIDLGHATTLMAEAFATWESARCGADGAPPSISVSAAFGPALCATPEFSPEAGNANLVIFRNEFWPYPNSGHELAATRLTVGDDGAIVDADIELNATAMLTMIPPLEQTMPDASAKTALDALPAGYDVLSVMIHEAGHFLGLDHSREENSLMLAELDPGAVRRRLTDDDIAAICAAYPPERERSACDPTPHGGFSPTCDESPILGGCSLVPRPRGRATGAAVFTVFAVLGAAARVGRPRRHSER